MTWGGVTTHFLPEFFVTGLSTWNGFGGQTSNLEMHQKKTKNMQKVLAKFAKCFHSL